MPELLHYATWTYISALLYSRLERKNEGCILWDDGERAGSQKKGFEVVCLLLDSKHQVTGLNAGKENKEFKED